MKCDNDAMELARYAVSAGVVVSIFVEHLGKNKEAAVRGKGFHGNEGCMQ